MKVAVCLSGLTRSIQYCFKTIETFLIEPYNADIFLHTWDINVGGGGAANRFEQAPAFRNLSRQEFFNNVKKKYGNRFVYQSESYEDKDWNFLNVPEHSNIVPMFYSIYKCNELKKAAGNYDLVIRSRMDSLYERFLPQEEVEQTQKENRVFVRFNGINRGINEPRNSFIWRNRPFVCDNFGFGNNAAMDNYASTYIQLNEIYKTAPMAVVTPEFCLGTQLCNNNISYQWSNITYKALIEWNSEYLKFESYYDSVQTILMKNYDNI